MGKRTRERDGRGALAGKVCAVTGAGSGIGRALAQELASRGARLALSDVSEAGLAGTAETLGTTEVHTQVLDVADREAVEAYAAAVAAHFGVVHQIYNNAGIGLARTVLESTYEDYDRILGVDLWGVIHGTKAFLPHLVASGDGHVVNISSLNGIMAQPGMSHYCTAKFAVRGFTESLQGELARDEVPVRTTVVHPGGIRTNIAGASLEAARAAGLPVTADDERRRETYDRKILRMPAARAAEIIIDGVVDGRTRVLVGRDAKALDAVVRLVPRRYLRLVNAMERRLHR